MADDSLLTKKETASYLRVSEKTIDQYRKQGKLIGSRIGGKVLFPKSRVFSALKKEKVNG